MTPAELMASTIKAHPEMTEGEIAGMIEAHMTAGLVPYRNENNRLHSLLVTSEQSVARFCALWHEAEADGTFLLELFDDIERWRESGGDARDLRHVLETADKILARQQRGAPLLTLFEAVRAWKACADRGELMALHPTEQAVFAALETLERGPACPKE